MAKYEEIVAIVYDRMFESFTKELFVGSSKQNSEMTNSCLKNGKRASAKTKFMLNKDQFCYQMDDGN